jgi:hypothetical protein
MATGTTLHKDVELLPDENSYRSVVGALLYLACNTRVDISHAVGCLSRFMNAPTTQHMTAAERVMRYLSGTIVVGLFYEFRAINHETSW